MNRQPFASCSYRDNAHLPDTYPIVRSGVSSHLGKRKDKPGPTDLRVQVLQDQAKKPNVSSIGTAKDALAPHNMLEGERYAFGDLTNSWPIDSVLSNSRPTDFTNLSALIGEDLPAPSSAASFNILSRPPSKPEPKRNVTVFADIATRQSEVPPVGNYNDTKSEIIQRSILHSDDSKLSSSLQRQASHMHSSRSAQQMQSLAGLKRPPIDWSLKTRALFHSRLPFEVCRQAVMAPGSSAFESLAAFASGSCSSTPSAMDQLTALDRFQRALMTWQHPDASMAPAVVSALSGSKSAQGLLDARKAAWQEAFRSLFMTLRAGACPAFYLATAQGCKRPYVAYFGGIGTSGRQHMHAWMSRSMHGLRERLRSEPHGLVFSTPLAPEVEPLVKDERIQAELRDIGHSRGPTLAAGIDNKPESLLFFEGASRVHGLFEYLLCEHSSSSEMADMPLLLAPVPFLGATLHQLQPQLLPSVEVQQRDSTASVSGGRGGHRMELQGLLPPWVLDRLFTVLQDSQHGQFQVALETDPLTTAFNLRQGTQSEDIDTTAKTRGLLDAEEARRWGSPAGDIASRVVRELVCDKDLYTVTLNRQ